MIKAAAAGVADNHLPVIFLALKCQHEIHTIILKGSVSTRQKTNRLMLFRKIITVLWAEPL
jgi:hypothetical protein